MPVLAFKKDTQLEVERIENFKCVDAILCFDADERFDAEITHGSVLRDNGFVDLIFPDGTRANRVKKDSLYYAWDDEVA